MARVQCSDMFQPTLAWPPGLLVQLDEVEDARDRALANVPHGPGQANQVKAIHHQTWDAMEALWAPLGPPHPHRASLSAAQAAALTEGPLISVMDLWATCQVMDDRIHQQGPDHAPWALWGRPTRPELEACWGPPDHQANGTGVWWFHLKNHPVLASETAWWVSATDHPRHLRAGARLPAHGLALQTRSQRQLTWSSMPLALWWINLARAFADPAWPPGWDWPHVPPWPVVAPSAP